MNIHYLMQYISYHLHTLVRRFSYSHEPVDVFCARIDFEDRAAFSSVSAYCSSISQSTAVPHILSVSGQLAYGIVPCPEYYYLVGPVRFTEPVYYLHETNNLKPDESWISSVSSCSFLDFAGDLLLMFNLHHTSTLTMDDLLKCNCIPKDAEETVHQHHSRLLFKNIEYQKTHNPYDQEIREQTSIEKGDLEGLKKSWEEDYSGELGTLSKDSLRNMKNMAIVIITLASRSAIRGGLLPEESFSLSDSYIQKVEDCPDAATALHISRSCEAYYTKLVRAIRERQEGTIKEKNPHINKCKDYIFKHLHDKISVQDIADTLCINANYLSELFHSCEGVTISRFILNEKLKLVKNLLTYSQYSYIEIANYLGFASQSYLGQQFKKHTGYTLKEYRDRYQLHDSM